jgi:hypothetical protein
MPLPFPEFNRTDPVPQFRIENEQESFPFWPEGQNLWGDDNGSPYRGARFSVGYALDTGLLQMPVASASLLSKSKLVRVHAPVSRKVVRWTVSREGEPPEMPAPETILPGEVFLRGQIGGLYPMPGGNGQTVIWRLFGTYEYAMELPYDWRNGLPLGRLPNVQAPASVFTISPGYFTADLIG